jgi:hypothetical protein
VHGRLGRRGHDEREQRKGAVLRAVQQPLADPAAHAARLDFARRRALPGGAAGWIGHRLAVLLREPVRVVEQPRKDRADRVARLLRRVRAVDGRLDIRHEAADDRRVEDVLVAHPPGSLTFS